MKINNLIVISCIVLFLSAFTCDSKSKIDTFVLFNIDISGIRASISKDCSFLKGKHDSFIEFSLPYIETDNREVPNIIKSTEVIDNDCSPSYQKNIEFDDVEASLDRDNSFDFTMRLTMWDEDLFNNEIVCSSTHRVKIMDALKDYEETNVSLLCGNGVAIYIDSILVNDIEIAKRFE